VAEVGGDEAGLACLLSQPGGRGVPERVGGDALLEPRSLRGAVDDRRQDRRLEPVPFETRAGELAIVPTPWGTRGYDGLRVRSNRENLGHGLRPPIALLADCVRMLDASERSIDRERIQRLPRMMELERSLTRSRQRKLSIER
jgi:hypothetical protein